MARAITSINELFSSVETLETKKPKKTAVVQTTLEAYHKKILKEMCDEKGSIDNLKRELSDIETNMSTSIFSDEYRQMNDLADELRKKISAIDNDDKRINYFLDAGDLLCQYFDAQETISNGTRVRNTTKSSSRIPSNSVLTYFMEAAIEDKEDKEDKEVKAKQKIPRRLASTHDSSEGMNRDKLMDKYLSIIDPTSIKSGLMPGSGIDSGWGICPDCSIEMTFYQNEAKLGCHKCGYEEFILIDSEKPSYKDPPREITYFAYKKGNHFNEWIAQFQAKETTDIPQSIIETMMRELKKERITDPHKVNKEKIRAILHKLKLSKMYDHVQQIKNRIQQQMTNLTLSKEMEEKLQHMFKEIQPSFIKFCPSTRSNFLSYPYVLYKLCQLLELDEFLPCFQFLKSREKLYLQDRVWEKICNEMRWQFIRSI